MLPTIKGLYTALITPFLPNNTLDIEGLAANIEFQIANGIDGLVALGTTGESPTLAPQEKIEVVETVMKATQGRVPVMVGCGSYSTTDTIKNARHAESMGASSLLVVTPYYNKPTQEGIYLHFKELSDAVNIPIILYNIQGRTALNISTETLIRISQLKNVSGVKEASGNILQMTEVIDQIAHKNPDFAVLSGDDSLIFSLIALGGHGAISVTSNLFPKQIKELTKLSLEGKFIEARKIHYELLPIMNALFLETNPIPIKAAMHALKMPSGECRLPLCKLGQINEEKLNTVLSNYAY